MATIIEMITAIVMLTPEDANLLKTTHPAPIQKTSIKTIPHPEFFHSYSYTIQFLNTIQRNINAKSADPIVIRPQVSPNTHCTNEQICLRFVIL